MSDIPEVSRDDVLRIIRRDFLLEDADAVLGLQEAPERAGGQHDPAHDLRLGNPVRRGLDRDLSLHEWGRDRKG